MIGFFELRSPLDVRHGWLSQRHSSPLLPGAHSEIGQALAASLRAIAQPGNRNADGRTLSLTGIAVTRISRPALLSSIFLTQSIFMSRYIIENQHATARLDRDLHQSVEKGAARSRSLARRNSRPDTKNIGPFADTSCKMAGASWIDMGQLQLAASAAQVGGAVRVATDGDLQGVAAELRRHH